MQSFSSLVSFEPVEQSLTFICIDILGIWGYLQFANELLMYTLPTQKYIKRIFYGSVMT